MMLMVSLYFKYTYYNQCLCKHTTTRLLASQNDSHGDLASVLKNEFILIPEHLNIKISDLIFFVLFFPVHLLCLACHIMYCCVYLVCSMFNILVYNIFPLLLLRRLLTFVLFRLLSLLHNKIKCRPQHHYHISTFYEGSCIQFPGEYISNLNLSRNILHSDFLPLNSPLSHEIMTIINESELR